LSANPPRRAVSVRVRAGLSPEDVHSSSLKSTNLSPPASVEETPAPAPDDTSHGFDTLCLHAGYSVHGDENTYGIGQGAPRGVPLHRSAPFQFKSTKHAADLFALRELGTSSSTLNDAANSPPFASSALQSTKVAGAGEQTIYSHLLLHARRVCTTPWKPTWITAMAISAECSVAFTFCTARPSVASRFAATSLTCQQ